MSFFQKEKPRFGTQKKRKLGKAASGRKDSVKKISTKRQNEDDDITSEESEGETKDYEEYSTSEDEDETADQKRKRLAQQHLEELKQYVASDDEDDGSDPIARRLRQENLARRGRLHKDIAHRYVKPTHEDITVCRGHQLAITCLVISPDKQHIFSGSKDCSIIKWSVATGKKVSVIAGVRKGNEKQQAGHTSHVLCLAISSDGSYLASGVRSRQIHVWNPDTCQLLHSARTHQHRDAVSGLAFRHGTHELYSASFDRTVKVWNVGEHGVIYVETLFGHQDVITAIDALSLERVVTSGARDGSVRVWKIVEESQLVFHGHSGSIDCVCYIDDSHFISGADDGSLALWSTFKKKPLVTVGNAHSGNLETTNDNQLSESESMELVAGSAMQSAEVLNGRLHSNHEDASLQTAADVLVTKKENWITAIAALRSTDFVVSGSKDGFLRFWQCGHEYKALTQLFALPLVGFINCLQFSDDGLLLVAGVGQEHKLGRWWRIKSAKNSVCIIRLKTLPASRKGAAAEKL